MDEVSREVSSTQENVRQLLAEHSSRNRDHSNKLWRLLNLELWHRVFIDRDSMLLGAKAA